MNPIGNIDLSEFELNDFKASEFYTIKVSNLKVEDTFYTRELQSIVPGESAFVVHFKRADGRPMSMAYIVTVQNVREYVVTEDGIIKSLIFDGYIEGQKGKTKELAYHLDIPIRFAIVHNSAMLVMLTGTISRNTLNVLTNTRFKNMEYMDKLYHLVKVDIINIKSPVADGETQYLSCGAMLFYSNPDVPVSADIEYLTRFSKQIAF